MRRSRWLVAGVAIACVPFFAGGITAGAGATAAAHPLWLAVVLGGAALVAAVGRRHGWLRRGADRGWSPVGSFEFVPARVRTDASEWAVSGALSRVEARWLLPGSMAFGVGIGFCLLLIALFGVVFARDHGGETAALVELLPIMIHPLAGMTVLAVYRARTRGRRDGVDELFATCPTSEHTRNVAHLRTAWVPAVTALAFAGLLVITYLSTTDLHWGPVGARQISHVFGAALLTVGAVALGVALARWTPWTLAPVIAVVTIGIASVQIATSGDRASDGSRQLSTWITAPEVPIRFTPAQWAAHYAWIAVLVAMTALVGLARDSGHRARLCGGLVVLACTAGVVAFVATRPVAASDAKRIAALLAQPSDHQTCADAGIPVCAYAGDSALAAAYAAAVRPVVAAAPRTAAAGLEIRQGADVERGKLDPAIAALIPPGVEIAAIPIKMIAVPEAYDSARLHTALRLVGITGEGADDPQVVAGEARGVVAVWLATRGLAAEHATRLASVRLDPNGVPTGPWPDSCFAGPSPVVWAMTDLEAARRLLAADDAAVRAVVRDRWTALIDPETSTDALLAALRLPAVGAPGARTPWPSAC